MLAVYFTTRYMISDPVDIAVSPKWTVIPHHQNHSSSKWKCMMQVKL